MNKGRNIKDSSKLSHEDSLDKRRRVAEATRKAHREIALNKARFGLRSSTIEKSQDSATRVVERSFAPPTGHMTATGRAVEDSVDPHTATRNQHNIDLLKKDKSYKEGAVRVHFKGGRNPDGTTTGNLLAGAHMDRSSWSKDQTLVSQDLGERLKSTPGFIGAPHTDGTHGAEIAHIRAQHAGGMTDELGAQPASWHYNVEDMAREEGQRALAERFGDNVRMKSTVYVHHSGDLAGTVKARRHKIYFRQSDGSWTKKFDHLQDGVRGNINKSEARALREQIKGLTADSPDVSLHGKMKKGIDPRSDISAQKSFRPTSNDSTTSPYFTDVTTVTHSTQQVKPSSKEKRGAKKAPQTVTVTNRERLSPSKSQALMQNILSKAVETIRKRD